MRTIAFSQPVKLKEVAEAAGVSVSTASRALANVGNVSPKTRARVAAAARRLGYHPNQLARGLRQGASRIVGLIVADLLNPFYALIAKGIQDSSRKHGYSVVLLSTDGDHLREAECLQVVRTHRLQGLLIVPIEGTLDNLERFADLQRLPVVEIDRTTGRDGVKAVLVDNIGGARAAVRHLLEIGHERIAIVAGRRNVTTSLERIEGYALEMRAWGREIRNEWMALIEPSETTAHDATMRLLDLDDDARPSAIFAFNNETTAGVLAALRARGLAVPTDMSVVGFDDSRWLQLLAPPITVVDQPGYELGYLAAEQLFDAMSRGASTTGYVRLETRLVIRGSTATPGAGAVRSRPGWS